MTQLILRLFWFYLVGLPIGSIWLTCGYLLCLTLIGMPLGVWMINKAPAIFTLKQEGVWKEAKVEGKIAYYIDEAEQPSFFLRALWFVFFGWWVSFLWATTALTLSASFIGMPIGFWMINRIPFMISLHRG